MRQAIRQAEMAFEADEVPVGAVAVYKNKIIAKAHNQMRTLKDPTAHAEMIAITQAANYLQAERLLDVDFYVTLEPCAMCAGAMVWARIHRLVYGAADLKAGACGSVLNLLQHPELNHRVELVPAICAEECGALMTEFFRQKRVEDLGRNN
ncbi:MAG: tRNA adenosine(34) deaminase TadA [Candidatus Omnitrophica bacterium]|nr:tRNA adenosine(34) deaminase TadA [Candidatus Omnitrophota bacterium]